jgi:hypothetical protein
MSDSATITQDIVLAAEQALKDLLRSPKPSPDALQEADEALQGAKLAAAQAAERARTRQALTLSLLEESRSRETARRESAAGDALAALAEAAPVVTIEYAGLKVTITLAGGVDFVARQSSTEAVRRVLHAVDRRFSDRLLSSRNAILAGRVPDGESFDRNFIQTLTDDLRHAVKFGGVSVEL